MSEQNKLESFQDKLMEFTSKIQANIYVQAVTGGLMAGMGVLIAGTVINIILNIPIPAFTAFLTNIGVQDFLATVVKIFQLTAPLTCFLIGYNLAKSKGQNPLQGGIVSFMAYLLSVPSMVDAAGNGILAFDSLNAQNITTAIVVGLSASALFCWSITHKLVIKLPDSVPPIVREALSAIPASCVTILPFVVLRFGLGLTAFGSLPGLITGVIAAPLASVGNTLSGHLILIFLCGLFFWCGVHSSIVANVAMIVMLPAMQENIVAVMSGMAAPNELSFMTFLAVLQLVGGTGCIIGLAIDTVLFAKSERYKVQGKIQLIPAIFNINEPAVYGMPIMLNPLFFIPFVLGPVAMYVLFYLGLKVGLYTTPITMLNSFIPGILQGFLMGGGFGLEIFFIVGTILSCVIWFPFLMAADRKEVALEKALKAKE